MKKLSCSLIGVFLLCLCVGPALADTEIKDLSASLDSFQLGMEVGSFYRIDVNPYFGSQWTLADGDNHSRTDWGELYGKMRLTAGKDCGWSKIEAQFGTYYAETIGPDVYGLASDTSEFGMNQAWIRFGDILGGPVGLKVGRQDIVMEKGFLIAQGDYQGAGIWLPYNISFPFAVQADAVLGPVSAAAFWAVPAVLPGSGIARVSDVGGNVDLYGLNLHYDVNEGSYVYGGVFSTRDDTGGTDNDFVAWDLGGQATLFGALTLEAEYVLEKGNSAGMDLDASAYWASATYAFPVQYAPFVRASYVFFSGDEDPTDDTEEGFNPLYSGALAWNRWTLGEQTGEVWLWRSNKKVWVAEAGFNPIEAMTVTAMYLNHTIAETESFGTNSDKWGDEVNLLVDWMLTDQLFMHVGAGFVTPGDAAEEASGDDKNAYFGQIWLSYSI